MSNQDNKNRPFNQAEYEQYVDELAAKYGVPTSVWKRMVQQESSWNLNAKSPKNARGLWQIMPATAKALGVDPTDPWQAADGALRLLRDNYNRFRSRAKNEKHAWMMAVAGYHGNPDNVEKDLDRGGYGLPSISDGSITTRDHVLKIFKDIDSTTLDRIPSGVTSAKGPERSMAAPDVTPSGYVDVPQFAPIAPPANQANPPVEDQAAAMQKALNAGIGSSVGMGPVAGFQPDEFGNISQETMGLAPPGYTQPTPTGESQSAVPGVIGGEGIIPGTAVTPFPSSGIGVFPTLPNIPGATNPNAPILGATGGRGQYNFERTGVLGDLNWIGRNGNAFVFKGKGPEDYYEASETAPGQLGAPRPRGDSFTYLNIGGQDQRFSRVGDGLFKNDANGQIFKRNGDSYSPTNLPDFFEADLQDALGTRTFRRSPGAVGPEDGWEVFQDEDGKMYYAGLEKPVVAATEWRNYKESEKWFSSLPDLFKDRTPRATVNFAGTRPELEAEYKIFTAKYGFADSDKLAQWFISVDGKIPYEMQEKLMRPTYTINSLGPKKKGQETGEPISVSLTRAPKELENRLRLPQGWFRYVGEKGADYVTNGEVFVKTKQWNNELTPLRLALPEWFDRKQEGDFTVTLNFPRNYKTWRESLNIQQDNDRVREVFNLLYPNGEIEDSKIKSISAGDIAEVTISASDSEPLVTPEVIASDGKPDPQGQAYAELQLIIAFNNKARELNRGYARNDVAAFSAGKGLALRPFDEYGSEEYFPSVQLPSAIANLRAAAQDVAAQLTWSELDGQTRGVLQAQLNLLNTKLREVGVTPVTTNNWNGSIGPEEFLRQTAYRVTVVTNEDIPEGDYRWTEDIQNQIATMLNMTQEQRDRLRSYASTQRWVSRGGFKKGQRITWDIDYGTINAALGGTNPRPLPPLETEAQRKARLASQSDQPTIGPRDPNALPFSGVEQNNFRLAPELQRRLDDVNFQRSFQQTRARYEGTGGFYYTDAPTQGAIPLPDTRQQWQIAPWERNAANRDLFREQLAKVNEDFENVLRDERQTYSAGSFEAAKALEQGRQARRTAAYTDLIRSGYNRTQQILDEFGSAQNFRYRQRLQHRDRHWLGSDKIDNPIGYGAVKLAEDLFSGYALKHTVEGALYDSITPLFKTVGVVTSAVESLFKWEWQDARTSFMWGLGEAVEKARKRNFGSDFLDDSYGRGAYRAFGQALQMVGETALMPGAGLARVMSAQGAEQLVKGVITGGNRLAIREGLSEAAELIGEHGLKLINNKSLRDDVVRGLQKAGFNRNEIAGVFNAIKNGEKIGGIRSLDKFRTLNQVKGIRGVTAVEDLAKIKGLADDSWAAIGSLRRAEKVSYVKGVAGGFVRMPSEAYEATMGNTPLGEQPLGMIEGGSPDMIAAYQQLNDAMAAQSNEGGTPAQAYLAALLSTPAAAVEGVSDVLMFRMLKSVRALDNLSNFRFSRRLLNNAYMVGKTSGMQGLTEWLLEEVPQQMITNSAVFLGKRAGWSLPTLQGTADAADEYVNMITGDFTKIVRDTSPAFVAGALLGGGTISGQIIGNADFTVTGPSARTLARLKDAEIALKKAKVEFKGNESEINAQNLEAAQKRFDAIQERANKDQGQSRFTLRDIIGMQKEFNTPTYNLFLRGSFRDSTQGRGANYRPVRDRQSGQEFSTNNEIYREVYDQNEQLKAERDEIRASVADQADLTNEQLQRLQDIDVTMNENRAAMQAVTEVMFSNNPSIAAVANNRAAMEALKMAYLGENEILRMGAVRITPQQAAEIAVERAVKQNPELTDEEADRIFQSTYDEVKLTPYDHRELILPPSAMGDVAAAGVMNVLQNMVSEARVNFAKELDKTLPNREMVQDRIYKNIRKIGTAFQNFQLSKIKFGEGATQAGQVQGGETEAGAAYVQESFSGSTRILEAIQRANNAMARLSDPSLSEDARNNLIEEARTYQDLVRRMQQAYPDKLSSAEEAYNAALEAQEAAEDALAAEDNEENHKALLLADLRAETARQKLKTVIEEGMALDSQANGFAAQVILPRIAEYVKLLIENSGVSRQQLDAHETDNGLDGITLVNNLASALASMDAVSHENEVIEAAIAAAQQDTLENPASQQENDALIADLEATLAANEETTQKLEQEAAQSQAEFDTLVDAIKDGTAAQRGSRWNQTAEAFQEALDAALGNEGAPAPTTITPPKREQQQAPPTQQQEAPPAQPQTEPQQEQEPAQPEDEGAQEEETQTPTEAPPITETVVVGYVTSINDDGTITVTPKKPGGTTKGSFVLVLTRSGEYHLLPNEDDAEAFPVGTAETLGDNIRLAYKIPADMGNKVGRIVSPAVYVKVGDEYLLKQKGEVKPLVTKASKPAQTPSTETRSPLQESLDKLKAALETAKNKLAALKGKKAAPKGTKEITGLRAKIEELKQRIQSALKGPQTVSKGDIVTMAMGVDEQGRIIPATGQDATINSLAVVRNPETGQLELTLILDTSVRKNRTANSAQRIVGPAFNIAVPLEKIGEAFTSGNLTIKNAIVRENGDGSYTLVERGSVSMASAAADTNLEQELAEAEQALVAAEQQAQEQAEATKATQVAELEAEVAAIEADIANLEAQIADQAKPTKPKAEPKTKKGKEKAKEATKSKETKPKAEPKTKKGKEKAKKAAETTEVAPTEEVVPETKKTKETKKPKAQPLKSKDGVKVEILDDFFTALGRPVTVTAVNDDGTVVIEYDDDMDTPPITVPANSLYAKNPRKGKEGPSAKSGVRSHRTSAPLTFAQMARAKAQRTRSGVKVNAEAAQLIAGVAREVFGQGGAFEGLFLRGALTDGTAGNTDRLIAGLRGAADYLEQLNQPEAAAAIRAVADVIAASRDANGSTILYVSDESIRHERLHYFSFTMGLQRGFRDRHTKEGFEKLIAHESLQKAWRNHYAELNGYDPNGEIPATMLGDVVEEIAVYSADGDYYKFGLTAKEAADYLDVWLTSFTANLGKQEGDAALKAFIKEVRYGRDKIRELQAARRGYREGSEYQESGYSVQRVEEARQEGTEARVNEALERDGTEEGISMMRRVGAEGPQRPHKLTQTVAVKRGLDFAQQMYTGVNFNEVRAAVQDILDEGLATATDIFHENALSRNPDRGFTIVLGAALMELYEARGQYNVAAHIHDRMAEWLTEMGQAVSLWGKVTAYDTLKATKKLKATYERIKGEPMSPEMEQQILDMAQRLKESFEQGALHAELLSLLGENLKNQTAEVENLTEAVDQVDEPMTDVIEGVTGEDIANAVETATKKHRPRRPRVLNKAEIKKLEDKEQENRRLVESIFGPRQEADTTAFRFLNDTENAVNAAVERLLRGNEEAMDEGPSFMLTGFHGGAELIHEKGGLSARFAGSNAIAGGWGIYIAVHRAFAQGYATSPMLDRARDANGRFRHVLNKASALIGENSVLANGKAIGAGADWALVMHYKDQGMEQEAIDALIGWALPWAVQQTLSARGELLNITHADRMIRARAFKRLLANGQLTVEDLAIYTSRIAGRIKENAMNALINASLPARDAQVNAQMRKEFGDEADSILHTERRDDLHALAAAEARSQAREFLDNNNFDTLVDGIVKTLSIQVNESTAELLQEFNQATSNYITVGGLYEVLVNGEIDEFYNYSEDYSNQSDYVKSRLALDPLFNEWYRENTSQPLANYYWHVVKQLHGRVPHPGEPDRVIALKLASLYMLGLGIKGAHKGAPPVGAKVTAEDAKRAYKSEHLIVFDSADVEIVGVASIEAFNLLWKHLNLYDTLRSISDGVQEYQQAADQAQADSTSLATPDHDAVPITPLEPSKRARSVEGIAEQGRAVTESVTSRLAKRLAPLVGDELLQELQRPDSEGPSAMLIGKEGAERLAATTDENLRRALQRERVDRTLSNMPKAEMMARRGIDPERIWLATGWFKGSDGEWRMEIPDPSLVKDIRLAEGDAYWLPDVFADDDYANMLFTAYPSMRHIMVRGLDPNNSKGYNGSYASGDVTIEVNQKEGRRAQDQVLNTVLHEVQHAVQSLEDFQNGQNTETIRAGQQEIKAARGRLKQATAIYNQIKKALAEAKKRNVVASATITITAKNANKYFFGGPFNVALWPETHPVRRPAMQVGNGGWLLSFTQTQMQEYVSLFEQNRKALEAEADEIAKKETEVARTDTKGWKTAIEMYLASAGETEARNVGGKRNNQAYLAALYAKVLMAEPDGGLGRILSNDRLKVALEGSLLYLLGEQLAVAHGYNFSSNPFYQASKKWGFGRLIDADYSKNPTINPAWNNEVDYEFAPDFSSVTVNISDAFYNTMPESMRENVTQSTKIYIDPSSLKDEISAVMHAYVGQTMSLEQLRKQLSPGKTADIEPQRQIVWDRDHRKMEDFTNKGYEWVPVRIEGDSTEYFGVVGGPAYQSTGIAVDPNAYRALKRLPPYDVMPYLIVKKNDNAFLLQFRGINHDWGYPTLQEAKDAAERDVIHGGKATQITSLSILDRKANSSFSLVANGPISEGPSMMASSPMEAQMIEDAANYESFAMFREAQFNNTPKYGMSHRPSWVDMPPASDLLEGETLPRDVYEKPEWSIASGRSMKDPATKESWEVLKSIRNNPDASVTLYRAAPKRELNVGDWVTLSPTYAEQSAESNETVHSFDALARDIKFAGDDINEFGYFPESIVASAWEKAKGLNAEGPSKMATIKDEEDRATRNLKDTEKLIPENERVAGPINKGERRTMRDGRPFMDADLDALGTADLTPEQTEAAWAKAIKDSSRKGQEVARMLIKTKGMAPNPAIFSAAMKASNRARYWYEVSAEAFETIFPDLTREERIKLIDAVAATSPQADPRQNMRRAVGLISEWFQGIPIETDIMDETAVKAVFTDSVDKLKTGSFSNTFQFHLGYTDRVPLSTNDRQVAASFGIDGDDIASNGAIYEVLSRFYINLTNTVNATLDENAEPYQSWQIQAPAWVVQRQITEPGRANDDYLMALVEDIIPALQQAGIMKGDALTREVLMDPRTPDVLSSTRRRFQKAPILTQNVLRSTSNEVQQALALAKEFLDQNKLRPLNTDTDALRGIVKRALRDFSTRHSGNPSLPERLAGLVLGKPSASVTRMKRSHISLGGLTIPQLRIPLFAVEETESSAWPYDATDRMQAMITAMVAKAFSLDEVTMTRLTPAEPTDAPLEGTQRTVSIFVKRYFADDSDVAQEFGNLIGHTVESVPFANGTRFDVLPSSVAPIDIDGIRLNAVEFFGPVTVAAKDLGGLTLTKGDINDTINDFRKGIIQDAVEAIYETKETNYGAKGAQTDKVTKRDVEKYVNAVAKAIASGRPADGIEPLGFGTVGKQRGAAKRAAEVGQRLRDVASVLRSMELVNERYRKELALWTLEHRTKQQRDSKELPREKAKKILDGITKDRKQIKADAKGWRKTGEGPSRMASPNHGEADFTGIDPMGEQTGYQQGSNPGGTYTGSDGKRRYIKFPEDDDHARSEVLANIIYRALGIAAPETVTFGHNGKVAIASTLMPLAPPGMVRWHSEHAKRQEFLRGFAADVLLANRDVIANKNTDIEAEGRVVRIDNGAALAFRARGERKLDADLDVINELTTFFTMGQHRTVLIPEGYNSVADMKDLFADQVADIAALRASYNGWDAFVRGRFPNWNNSTRDRTVQMLEARTDALIQAVADLGMALPPRTQPPTEIRETYEGPSRMATEQEDQQAGFETDNETQAREDLMQKRMLTDEQMDAVVELMTLWLVRNIPGGAGVGDFMKELGSLSGNSLHPDDMWAIHAAAVDSIKTTRPPATPEQRAASKARQEHYTQAKIWEDATDTQAAQYVTDIMKEVSQKTRDWSERLDKLKETLANLRTDASELLERIKSELDPARKMDMQQELKALRKDSALLASEIERVAALKPPKLNQVQAIVNLTQDTQLISATLILLTEGVGGLNAWMGRQGLDQDDAAVLLRAADRILEQSKKDLKRKAVEKRKGVELTQDQVDEITRQEQARRTEALRLAKENARMLEPIRRTKPQAVWSALMDMGRATLLLHPKTHLINMLSTLSNVVLDHPATMAGSVMDRILAIRSGRRTTVFDLRSSFNGFMAVFRQDAMMKQLDRESGIKLAYHILRNGTEEDTLQSLQLTESTLRTRFSHPAAKAVSMAIDAYINVVFRALGAEDALFKVWVFRKAIEDEAHVLALNDKKQFETETGEKFSSEQYKSAFDWYMQNPTEMMVELAKERALELTYQSENILSAGLSSARERLRTSKSLPGVGQALAEASKIPIPFDRTPTNLILAALEYLPVSSQLMAGWQLVNWLRALNHSTDAITQGQRNAVSARFGKALMADIAADPATAEMTEAEIASLIKTELDKLLGDQAQRAFARIAGRGIVGLPLTALGVWLGYMGLLTGFDEPEREDEGERADFWERMYYGIDPRSVGGYFNLPDSPFFTSLLMAGTIGNAIWRQNPQDAFELLGTTVDAVGENYWEFIHTHPVLQTLANYEGGGSDTWGAYFGMTTMRFVPGARLLDMWGQVTDPLPRKRAGLPAEEGDTPFFSKFGRDYMNAIQTRIPYWRESAPDQKRKPVNDMSKSLVERLMKESSPLKINTNPDWDWRRTNKFQLQDVPTPDIPITDSPVRMNGLPQPGGVRMNGPIMPSTPMDATPKLPSGMTGAAPILPSRQKKEE